MQPHEIHKYLERVDRKPGLAVLISPWPTLISELHRETRSDFLTVDSLHAYACSYACYTAIDHPILSPGCCDDMEWLREASPVHGYQVFFGSEELLADDVRRWEDGMRRAGVGVEVKERIGEVHAGVVADLFLKSRRDQRIRGLRDVVLGIQGKIGRKEEKRGA
jgi:acetyl esterase/lipase